MRPTVERVGDALQIPWSDDRVLFELGRWRTSRDGATIAECCVTTTAPGVRPLLHLGTLNLLSPRSQADLARACQAAYSGPEWSRLVRETCLLALDRHRAGGPVIGLATVPDEPARYRWAEVIPEDGPTLGHGPGGSLKSYLFATALAGCVSLGEPFLGIPTTQGRVLVVDFETDPREHARRLRAVARGMEWSELPNILYHQPETIIADSGPELRYLCDNERVDFVVIDSLGYGGMANVDSEPVMAGYRAIRSLHRPVLCIYHPPRAVGDAVERNPYGSVYHEYSARSILEVRRAQDAEDASTVYLGLFHRKHNSGPKHVPIGAQVTFADGGRTVIVRQANVREVAELAEGLPLTARIAELLKHGAQFEDKLADELGITGDKKRKGLGSSLRTMKSRGRLDRLPDGRWGLAAVGASE